MPYFQAVHGCKKRNEKIHATDFFFYNTQQEMIHFAKINIMNKKNSQN